MIQTADTDTLTFGGGDDVWLLNILDDQPDALAVGSKYLGLKVGSHDPHPNETATDERPIYLIAAVDTLATRCNAMLSEAYESGDLTATVDNITSLDGDSPIGDTDELTVIIYFDYWPDADVGTKVKIERNKTSGKFEIYQMDC